jgi:hypothetical protein
MLMSYGIIARRSLGAIAAAAALLTVAPAASATTTSLSSSSALTAALAPLASAVTAVATASCTAPALTQPFLAFGDANFYALMPGESYASGWLLSGGAKIVSVKLNDGTTGSVLDLPSGATAISPAMCVTDSYPTARTMIRDLAGTAGVSIKVAYLSSNPSLVATGTVTGSGPGWTLSPVINIDPSTASGWQLAWFAFTATGSSSEYQLYNLYVDPRMH